MSYEAMSVFDLHCQVNHTVTLMQELGGANNPVLFAPLYLIYSVIGAYSFSDRGTWREAISFAYCLPDDSSLSTYDVAKNPFVDSFFNIKRPKYDDKFRVFLQSGLPTSYRFWLLLKMVQVKAQYPNFKSGETVQVINDAIANMTNQSISQIVSVLNPDTAELDMWAIVFENKWKMKFNEPKNGTFYVNAAVKKTIPMLQQTSEEIGYLETEHFHALRLPFDNNPYRTENCTMNVNGTKQKHKCVTDDSFSFYFLVFLPQKRFGLSDALGHLNGFTIEKLIEANNSKIDLTLPSFNLEYTTTFDQHLRKIGAKKPFDPKKADIPYMFSKRVYAGGLTQKIQFKINSNGSNFLTAGVDQMIVQKRSKRAVYKKIEFDEPFVYMVYASDPNETNILYAGVFH